MSTINSIEHFMLYAEERNVGNTAKVEDQLVWELPIGALQDYTKLVRHFIFQDWWQGWKFEKKCNEAYIWWRTYWKNTRKNLIGFSLIGVSSCQQNQWRTNQDPRGLDFRIKHAIVSALDGYAETQDVNEGNPFVAHTHTNHMRVRDCIALIFHKAIIMILINRNNIRV